VFWVVDNGSSHRGQAAIDRLATQFPNAITVHTPYLVAIGVRAGCPLIAVSLARLTDARVQV
jgi:hypothetical protein